MGFYINPELMLFLSGIVFGIAVIILKNFILGMLIIAFLVITGARYLR